MKIRILLNINDTYLIEIDRTINGLKFIQVLLCALNTFFIHTFLIRTTDGKT